MNDKVKEDIKSLFSKIIMPNGMDIISNNSLENILIKNEEVFITLLAEDSQQAVKLEYLKKECTDALNGLKKFKNIKIVFTSKMSTIKNIIAISSGKGGVGKSTLSTNLAVALGQNKLKVGLLDADIYGPSQPKLMGINKKPVLNSQNKIEPIEAFNVKSMSIGFMIDEEKPIIWRGPMIQNALSQLIKDVNWGNLDLLIVDMPPGTGDTHLTITQKLKLDGAIIISTPQDIALIDAIKGLNMYKKVNIPILGIIENMSNYTCPNCGHEEYIFGKEGALKLAKEMNVELLAQIPLSYDIRKYSDEGYPIVAKKPNSDISKIYKELALKIMQSIKL